MVRRLLPNPMLGHKKNQIKSRRDATSPHTTREHSWALSHFPKTTPKHSITTLPLSLGHLYLFCPSDHLNSITNLLCCLVKSASHLESTLPAQNPQPANPAPSLSSASLELSTLNFLTSPNPFISSPSYPLRTLELSCRFFSRPRPLFSMLYTLFAQNTRGVGLPSPIEDRNDRKIIHFRLHPAALPASHPQRPLPSARHRFSGHPQLRSRSRRSPGQERLHPARPARSPVPDSPEQTISCS